MNKKVSIIVPCYNVEDYIEKCINSILNQTYKNIELILINDGSTDRTEKFIFRNKEKLKAIKLKYLKKENGGLGSAIAMGLKNFSGDYLIWIDPDDLLDYRSIEKRVKFLEDNREYDLVRSGAKIVSEHNLEKKIGDFYNNNSKKENIFLDLIIEKTYLCCGTYMLKREKILKNIKNLKIYESVGGQNWQMLLPNTYNQKCGYIDEELYTYVVRGNSHSHKNSQDLLHMIERWKEHKKILDITINNMNMSLNEKNKYLNIIKEKYLRKNILVYLKLDDKENIEKYYKLLKRKDIKIKVIYFLWKFNLLNLAYKVRGKITKN